MEKEKKKKWETPKLICLYRGRPEEAVLQGCKTKGITGANGNTHCIIPPQQPCDTDSGT